MGADILSRQGTANPPTGGGVYMAEVQQSGSGLVHLRGVDPLSASEKLLTHKVALILAMTSLKKHL